MIQSIRRSTSDILAASVPARRRACHATTALLVVGDDTAEAKTAFIHDFSGTGEALRQESGATL